MSASVSRTPTSSCFDTVEYSSSCLWFETDCWDVHYAIENAKKDFVLYVRSEEMYQTVHVPTATNWPHREISESNLGSPS